MNTKSKTLEIFNQKIVKYKDAYFYSILWFAITIPVYYFPVIQQYNVIFALYIIAGIIVVASHFTLSPFMEGKVREAYDHVLKKVKDRSLIEGYKEDTEDWITKIFHKDYSIIKIMIIFSIVAIISVASILITSEMNIVSEFFPDLAYLDQKELFILLSTNGLGIISLLTLIYSYIRINIILFGTSNIIHHFTFWEIEEQKEGENQKNPLGELIIVNIFFFLLQTVLL
ncbi:MAG: hypothetical protein GF364_08670, partial [Candidatus Lokiarchaeota archaeon]|nr:hypothetical protein [Candidatus Lokiarchaeota archaeon]